eukprot:Gregarina_sp_Pseudo_9__436@NODE_1282_length_1716_cov_29_041741_g1205_i0_p1_GENE_NODE_1282_length_1716_cov_29_041741_g1205_i0NODE_1282_length_1716_cov_29_041741_g1205_i0_p1_ORF_typecomplete_len335_score67_09Cluap1/PF10234_9/0_17FeoA/PF04023_14/2e03FeoA/PF04023_14/0_9FeoA/PF04023_14/6_8e03CAGE1/PF15066_6/0_23_NODE_1282_length_1716_cov_29_041741_g1205_i05251529
MESKMWWRNQTTRVETIALKKKLSACETGRRLLEQLQKNGERLTASCAIEVLKQQGAMDEDDLLTSLRELQKERPKDRTKNRGDCRAMLKHCASTDPHLAERILQETSPCINMFSTPEFLKSVRDRFDDLTAEFPWGRFEATQCPREFVEAVYRPLDILFRRKLRAWGAEKGCEFSVLSERVTCGRRHLTCIVQIAGRRTLDRGRLALAQARAFAAQWHRSGSRHVPRRVASVWGRIWRDNAKFHVWCGTLSGEEFLLHMEERPVSFYYRRDAPFVDNGALQRLLWLTGESPLDAIKPPAATSIEEIEEDDDFQYNNSDDDLSSSEDDTAEYCL